METIFKPYRNLYASIAGRTTRTQFWLFTIYIIIGTIIFDGLLMTIIGSNMAALSTPYGLMNVMASGMAWFFGLTVVLMPLLYLTGLAHMALACRRMHDQDRSAWWLFVGIVPLIGWLVVLIFMFLPGTAGGNRYGPDPRLNETMPDVFS